MPDGSLVNRPMEDLWERFFGSSPTVLTQGRWEVPTDVFHVKDALVIRMELPGVRPEDVEVTTQDNNLVINGTRRFPHEGEDVRFLRRGSFYGEFTQRIALGRGLALDRISARYDNGILELRVPYTEEVQPRKIEVEVGTGQKELQQS